MVHLLLELVILLLSSLVSLAVVYYKMPNSVIQQIIAFLVAVLLVFLNRFILARSKPIPYSARLVLIALVATFLQLLVLSTGGFYSPFLILFHLFTIGTSFLFSLRVAIGFLSFSIIALIINTVLDKKLLAVFLNDPWSTILYLVSFAAIIPLYQLVVSRYHLEGAISRILNTQLKFTANQLELKSNQLQLTKKREESLLGGLSDLVIVTDTSLRILSFNEAALRALKLTSSELLGNSFFDVLQLRDINGGMVDVQFLSIDKALSHGTTHIIENLLLYAKNTALPKKVNIRIHPAKNLEGKIDQLVFVISGFYSGEDQKFTYRNTAQALLRHTIMLEELKNELEKRQMSNLEIRVELLGKTEQDILTVAEIEDHGIKPNFDLINIAGLIQHIVDNEKEFAKGLNVPIELVFDKGFAEKFSTFEKGDDKDYPEFLTAPYFTALADSRWFDMLVTKMIDLAILLSLKEKNPRVNVLLSSDNGIVTVTVSSFYLPPLPLNFENLILTEYYGALSNQINLNLGSGLEGFLVKTVAALLNISLTIKYQESPPALNFTIQLSQKPIQ